MVGEGVYGEVLKCWNLETGEFVAIKPLGDFYLCEKNRDMLDVAKNFEAQPGE